MNYRNFAEHSENYTIDGVNYIASLNFVNGSGSIKNYSLSIYITFALEEYEDFDGNMEEFIKSKLGESNEK